MKTYLVEVSKTLVLETSVLVDANNADEAERVAIKKAKAIPEENWQRGDSDYDVESIDPDEREDSPNANA